jgi:hypothetical protein
VTPSPSTIWPQFADPLRDNSDGDGPVEEVLHRTFQYWIDVEGDCQDTRAEVRIAEFREGTDGGFVIETGDWFFYYDRETWTDASGVDIDHMVALAEASGSGAKLSIGADEEAVRQRSSRPTCARRCHRQRQPAQGRSRPGNVDAPLRQVVLAPVGRVKLRRSLTVNRVGKRRLVALGGAAGTRSCGERPRRWCADRSAV